MQFEQGAAIVRERSAGLCELCPAVGVQTHHRLPRGMGGVSRAGLAVNGPSNLIRVCLACHADAESRRGRALRLGRLVGRGETPAEIPVWLDSVQGRGWYHLHDDGTMTWADLPEPSLHRATDG